MREVEQVAPVSRNRRFRRGLIATGLVVLVALLVAWAVRRPVATHFIDRYLAQRGVPARYQVSDLGLGRQRLVNVVIGDPAHPDLVADWVEVHTRLTLAGVEIPDVRAGRLRVRARYADGRLSLGALDRLIPQGSAPPGRFALPAVEVAVEDLRGRVETPWGVLGIKAAGRGRLDDGFAGEVAVVANRLAAGGCRMDRVALAGRLTIRKRAPAFSGPVRAQQVACGATQVRGVATTAAILGEPALAQWRGNARVTVDAVAAAAGQVSGIDGSLDFDGSAKKLGGQVELTSGPFSTRGVHGEGLSLRGGYDWRPSRMDIGWTGPGATIAMRDAVLSSPLQGRVAALAAQAGATPVAPLAARVAQAAGAAGARFSLEARGAAVQERGQTRLLLREARIVARSGARIGFRDGEIGYVRDAAGLRGRLRTRGTLTLAGGGLPEGRVTLVQPREGGALSGTAEFAPYSAGGARLALAPVRFSATPQGNTHVRTAVALTGPIPGGRLEGLRVPIDAVWNGGGRLVVNPDCAPAAVERLRLSGLHLARVRTTLCPVEGGWLTLDGRRAGGGVRLGATGIAGSIGSSPLTLQAAGATVRLRDGRFAANGLQARIGAPERATRLDFARFGGSLATLSGDYAGGGGQIANVPLLLSDASGRWSLRDGSLETQAALTVSDAAAAPRFVPMRASDVMLTLAANRIETMGVLGTAGGVKVADVVIRHDLGAGSGAATLAVPGLVFRPRGFQPTDLTALTLGVIADVDGRVTGEGHIRWDAAGVTSDGVFAAHDVNLAAAFGPASGINGTIRFTDLLNLQSAPGQVARVASVNPGIAVTDGTIRFQTLPQARVRIEEGRWPFAGGSLVLEPTLLDFGQAAERRMTFTATGVQARQFLQQFEFENLDATGMFDGTLPMIFDERGGRIENGQLVVRAGGGSIAYLGELTKEDLGTWGNLAFQALRSLRYRSLGIVMNGPLDGEMITAVRFEGVSQGEGAKSNFLIRRLQRLPFVFNVRIAAPFRQLIDSAQGFYDPSRLVQRNLPALIKQQQKGLPVQPEESRIVP